MVSLLRTFLTSFAVFPSRGSSCRYDVRYSLPAVVMQSLNPNEHSSAITLHAVTRLFSCFHILHYFSSLGSRRLFDPSLSGLTRRRITARCRRIGPINIKSFAVRGRRGNLMLGVYAEVRRLPAPASRPLLSRQHNSQIDTCRLLLLLMLLRHVTSL